MRIRCLRITRYLTICETREFQDFIDNEYHQSTFNKLQDDIINQVMLKVKSTEVKGNYDKLIRRIEDEITFLRKELHSLDSLIEKIIQLIIDNIEVIKNRDGKQRKRADTEDMKSYIIPSKDTTTIL